MIEQLISGTDLRGRALGDDAKLTPDIARRVGKAFAAYLTEVNSGKPKVYIGRDSRLSGPDILDACAEGLRCGGAQVVKVGLCTTPAMFMTLITDGWGGDGAVMVTASHMPSEMNGLKMILPSGGLDHSQLERIVELAGSDRDLAAPGGNISTADFLPAYKNLLRKRIADGLGTDAEKPLKGLHVVVDPGNGAGGFYAGFMEEMGASIEGSVNLEPDGAFPVHIPNPEDPTAMRMVSEATVKAGADLGVIFDADCDRAAIVDPDGREINRNRLIALISAVLLNQKKGLSIVTDSVTSTGLRLFIEKHGGEQYRYKRGYRNVIEEARRLNARGFDCPLAIETSGHAALKENHFLDDGMYLVTVLICEAMRLKQQGRTLGSLIEDLKEPVESAELRLKILDEDFRKTGQNVIDQVTESAASTPGWNIAPDNREGIRITFDLHNEKESAWFLLRLSVHDPVMPINLESDVPGGCLYMAKGLLDILKKIPGLDLDRLNAFILNGK